MPDSPARKAAGVKDERKATPKGPGFLNPTQLVTLIVGPERKEFSIHKDFACHYSPVLKATFNSTFIEGQTQTYTLEHVTEPVARALVHWIYTQKLDVDPTIVSVTTIKAADQDFLLVRLWELAEELLIRGLQNLVVHTMVAFQESCNAVPAHTIVHVWESTAKGSPLRRLLLHQCATFLGESWYSQHPNQFPNEMLLELVEIFAKFKDVPKLKKAFGFKDKNDLTQYEATED